MNDFPDSYMAGLSAGMRRELARVNRPGLAALRHYLSVGEAVAFLGAGVSAPPYPLWDGLIGELVDFTASGLDEREAEALRALAIQNPEEVVEILRRHLGHGVYLAALRRVLRVRVDPKTGRTWTPVMELVCRCNFAGIITTTYDPGIVDARMQIRRSASATGFMTWQDELGLDRWRNGDIFGDTELPVLYMHGHQGQPDSVLLATTEYRRAYAGKLSSVLRRLLDGGHAVWIGFSFTDQRIAAIVREAASGSGTQPNLGTAPRHVAFLPWDPVGRDSHPGILARRSEIGYGALAVLYPAPENDHSALATLLSALTDSRYPAFADLSTPTHVGRSPDYDSRRSVKRSAQVRRVKHAFISYVREDTEDVTRLQGMLEAADIRVWRDTADLWPGEDWRAKIRNAIANETLTFLACFSSKSTARKSSYQNEEILLAVDQLRLRRPGDPWLIPIRFDECAIPDIDIGAGRSLTSIQHVDLFGSEYQQNGARLIAAIGRILPDGSDEPTA
jgi:hypothetical protein